MVFSSVLFLTIFLPVFLLVYTLLPKVRTLKHIALLFFSFVFYAWGEPRFVFVIFATTLLDFFIVKWMAKTEEQRKRKLLLLLSLLVNLGMLFYFKYLNFFVDSGNSVLHWFHIDGLKLDRLALPIGISFFAFESVTYAVDVYRRIHKPLTKFWEYQMYIIFFPKLIAGPIVRYHDIADQISNHLEEETSANRVAGFVRFCVGLGKKVLLANVMGQQADAIYALPHDVVNSTIAWVGAIAYTFQIYFDFSGYSDMALGLARMLGFRLPENFNNPYVAQSITDFWKRWHITLGAWMRNYLYIPLGGNRVGERRLFFNLFLVFLLSGLWHGASWNYVLWGVYHGCFLIIERVLAKRGWRSRIQPLNIVYSFLVVLIGWVIFRNENLNQAGFFLQKMVSFDWTFERVFFFKANFFLTLIVVVFFATSSLFQPLSQLQEHVYFGSWKSKHYVYYLLLGLIVYALSLTYLSHGGHNPFIYYRF